MTNLFGYKKGAYTGAEKDTPGLLALADGGILFMDEVHGLKPECQEKIFLFMDKGIYHMVGDNDVWYESNARVIFATTMQPSEVLLKTLLRRIPLIVKVPSLAERPLQEKRRLLQFLIQEEEQHIQREICLSDLVYRTLERHVFAGNVGGLKNCIRASVAKAFLRSQEKQKHVELHLYDLPSDLLESTGQDLTLYSYDDKTMIRSGDMLVNIQKDGHLYKLKDVYKRQLLNDPAVLILDEPTAGLDPKERNQFSQLLSEMSKDKIILLSTHIVSDVEAIADQIMIMKKGCLIAHDTPQKLLSMLDGRVKERQVSQKELEQLRGHAVICYQRASTQGTLVRYLDETGRDACSVEPTLNDLYLYHFQEEEA